jgi:uncharacterized membrane protein
MNREDGGYAGIVWQRETGLVDFGARVGLGETPVYLYGVSRSGQVVVGCAGDRAFRWTRAGGLVWLAPNDGSPSAAFDVSADGRVAVGQLDRKPVMWVGEGGPTGLAADGVRGAAWSVSADGRTVAGATNNSRRPFRWHASTGLVDLGSEPGTYGLLIAPGELSGDGRKVCSRVVLAQNAALELAVTANPRCVEYPVPECWTETTGNRLLPRGTFAPGPLPHGCSGILIPNPPLAVSHDGAIVAGSLSDGERLQVAMRWDGGDPREIGALLAEQGIDIGGWELTNVTSISADGQTMVGTGISPSGAESAWIAVVPRSP